MIADALYVINEDVPLRWVASDHHVYELPGSESLTPRDLGPDTQIKGPMWDDKYWYRPRCYEDCEAHDSFGIPVAIERIDRVTGESMRLGKGAYGLGSIFPYGDYVYWGVFGHGIGGGVFRVPKTGGDGALVRIAAYGEPEDRVHDLHAYALGILVRGERTLSWIPGGSAAGKTILRDVEVGAAVLDGDVFYVADRGDPYVHSKASGSIRRVTMDGVDRKLVGPLRWPSAIASFGTSVYYMLEESGDVWTVSKEGGEPRQVVSNGPRLASCDRSLGLWVDARGLFWLRGYDGFLNHAARLYFLPWSAIPLEHETRKRD